MTFEHYMIIDDLIHQAIKRSDMYSMDRLTEVRNGIAKVIVEIPEEWAKVEAYMEEELSEYHQWVHIVEDSQ